MRDDETLERIRKLAIPPAWTDVWICPSPTGHLQATGRDARGRKQYRYHARYRRRREAAKYERLVAFAKALPAIRKKVDADLARPGAAREKVLAAVVRLLELTLIRVGNDEYARLNRSFGLTTLRNRHATVRGSSVKFRFRGKSGKDHEVRITRPAPGSGRPPLSRPARPGPVPVRGRGGPGRRHPFRRRERLPPRGRPGRHRQGLPDVGRNGPRLPSPARPRRPDDRRGGQAQRHQRDPRDCQPARQHARGLPPGLRPPDRRRGLPRRPARRGAHPGRGGDRRAARQRRRRGRSGP